MAKARERQGRDRRQGRHEKPRERKSKTAVRAWPIVLARTAASKFRPLHDRVVIRRVGPEEKSAGGILIPDTAREKPMEGEVVAVGRGVRADDGTIRPLDVGVGDRVLFGKWSGTEIKLDGEEMLILPESDLMGVVVATTSNRTALRR